jgi:uncharacterized protein (TIGR02246 family)
MLKRAVLKWAAMCYVFAMTSLTAQTDLHHDDREALLKLLSRVEQAINAQDIEGMIAVMHPDCTVTWWNAEVSHGHAEIRAYYNKMVKDPGRIITKYTTTARLDGHARFVGAGADIALAQGSMEDEFFPQIRGPFKLNSRWSSTVAKTSDGEWKIASLHLSANVFTNTLISELTSAIWMTGAAALVTGGVVGWLLGRRKSSKTT